MQELENWQTISVNSVYGQPNQPVPDFINTLRKNFDTAQKQCNRRGWYLVGAVLRHLTPVGYHNGLVIAKTAKAQLIPVMEARKSQAIEALQRVNQEIKQLTIINTE